MGYKAVLFIDKDRPFLAAVKAASAAVVVAVSAEEARVLMMDESASYQGIFIGSLTHGEIAPDLVRFAHRNRPGTPLYFIEDKSQAVPFTEEQVRAMGVCRVVSKPEDNKEISSLLGRVLKGFSVADSLLLARGNRDAVGAQLDRSDKAFIPARAESFLSGEVCCFDIYVRVRAGRFIMLHRAGSPFPEERLVAYMKRGIHTLYLRREAQESYMSYCDHVVAEHHRSMLSGLTTHQAKDLNLGALALGHLKNAGVPLSRLARAVEFLKSIQELAHNVGLLENAAVRQMIADQQALRNASATVMVVYLLMEAMDFTSMRLQHAVGLGALFHDVGMFADGGYHQHPINSAKILAPTGLFAPVILQGIEQHHERRNRLGFPRCLGAGSIGRVAEIIGFADEFVNLVQEAAQDPTIDPIFAAKVRLADGFSSEVLSAFDGFFDADRMVSI